MNRKDKVNQLVELVKRQIHVVAVTPKELYDMCDKLLDTLEALEDYNKMVGK